MECIQFIMKCQACGHTIVHIDGNICPICKSSIIINEKQKDKKDIIGEILWEMIALLKGRKSFEELNKFWVEPLKKYTEQTLKEAVKRISLQSEYFPSLKNFIDECEKIEREHKESLEFNLLTNEKLLDFIIEKSIKNPEIRKYFTANERIQLINHKHAIIKKTISELEQEAFNSIRSDLLNGSFEIISFINNLLNGFKNANQS